LDDLDTRAAVARDPATMIDGDGPVLIDEYQHAPVVLDAIKARLNISSRPGQFILTGSARHEALPRAAQALTGRLQRLPILPLAQKRTHGQPDPTWCVGCSTRQSAQAPSPPPARAVRTTSASSSAAGSRSRSAAPSGRARWRWIDDYVRLTLERDVQELSKLRQAHALPLILEKAAGQTAQILNVSRLADAAGIDAKTARDYLRLLEAGLPAQARAAVGSHPHLSHERSPRKCTCSTQESRARLLRLTPEKLGRRDPVAMTELGHLLGDPSSSANSSRRPAGLRRSRGSATGAPGTTWKLISSWKPRTGGVIGFEVKGSGSGRRERLRRAPQTPGAPRRFLPSREWPSTPGHAATPTKTA
jgi:hypothetical protein